MAAVVAGTQVPDDSVPEHRICTMNRTVLDMVNGASDVGYDDVLVWSNGSLVPLLDLLHPDWLAHFSLGDVLEREDWRGAAETPAVASAVVATAAGAAAGTVEGATAAGSIRDFLRGKTQPYTCSASHLAVRTGLPIEAVNAEIGALVTEGVATRRLMVLCEGCNADTAATDTHCHVCCRRIESLVDAYFIYRFAPPVVSQS